MKARAFLNCLPLVVALPLLLAGCSGSEKPAETPTTGTVGGDAKPKSDLKVALLTPGPVSDAGWSALAYQGLKQIETDLGAEVANQEATDTKIKDALRSYSQQGYKLIIGHGFEYNEKMVEVGKDFPDTFYISSSGGGTASNVGAFRFYLEQSCYLSGMLAAKLSKTNAVGMVAAIDVPSINSTLKAFAAGARAVKPDIKVIGPVYMTGEGDVASAKKATLEVIAQGADFVIHQANAGAQGVFDACKEKGIMAFGTNLDQNDNASGIVLASATIVAGPAFVDLAKQIEAKTFKGSIVLMGMDKGAIDFVVNPKLKDKIPADVMAELEKTKEDIKSGKLVVPKDEF